MAISGQQNINIGLPNSPANSDSILTAFTKTEENFNILFASSSPITNLASGNGIAISNTTPSSFVITNTGVTKLVAGNNIIITTVGGSAANTGELVISSIGSGNGGGSGTVNSVGVTSNSLSVTNTPIVSDGNINIEIPVQANVLAGNYSNPVVTINPRGIITAISNGSGSGTVTSVGLTAGTGIQVSGGPITSSGFMTVTNTGVTSIVAGTGVSINQSTGAVTISSSGGGGGGGTVTRVGLVSNTLTVTDSPIVSSGNIRVEIPASIDVSLLAAATGNITTIHASNVTATRFSGITANVTTVNSSNVNSFNFTAFTANVGNVNTNRLSATGNADVANVNAIKIMVSGNLDAAHLETISANATRIVANTSNATTFNGLTANVTTVNSSNVNSFNFTGANANVANVNTNRLSVTGNSLTGNLSANGNVIANNFIGNVSGVSTLANYATYSGTVLTNAQPNITSLGTLSGLTVSGNVNVTGNINATGNLNYQDVTNLVVGDPLVYIAANNTTSDLLDIGFVGGFNDGTYQHTGFARDHTDGVWKVFANVVNEPTTVIDWANATYPAFKAGAIAGESLSVTGNANVDGIITSTNSISSNRYFISRQGNLGYLLQHPANGATYGYFFINNDSIKLEAGGVTPVVLSSNSQVVFTAFPNGLSRANGTFSAIGNATVGNIAATNGTLTTLSTSGNINVGGDLNVTETTSSGDFIANTGGTGYALYDSGSLIGRLFYNSGSVKLEANGSSANVALAANGSVRFISYANGSSTIFGNLLLTSGNLSATNNITSNNLTVSNISTVGQVSTISSKLTVNNAAAVAGQRALLTLPSGTFQGQVRVYTLRTANDNSGGLRFNSAFNITRSGGNTGDNAFFTVSSASIDSSNPMAYQWYFDNATGNAYFRVGQTSNSYDWIFETDLSTTRTPTVELDSGVVPAGNTVSPLYTVSSNVANTGYKVLTGNNSVGLLIDSTGNVGIANLTPRDNLAVTGTAFVSGNLTAGNVLGNGVYLTGINASNISSGTLSTTRLNATSNTTDFTSGKVQRVGDFGIGGVAVAVTDFTANDVNYGRVFRSVANVTGGPPEPVGVLAIPYDASPSITFLGIVPSSSGGLYTGYKQTANGTPIWRPVLMASTTGNANIGNIAIPGIASAGTLSVNGNITTGNISSNGNVSAANWISVGTTNSNGLLSITTAANVSYIQSSANTTGGSVNEIRFTGFGATPLMASISSGGYLTTTGAIETGGFWNAPFYNAKFNDRNDGSGMYITAMSANIGHKSLSGDAFYFNSGNWRSNNTTGAILNLHGGAVTFYTNNGLTPSANYTPTQRMVILASGNVGIANNAPTHTLSVTGTFNASGNANVGNLGTTQITTTGNINTTGNLVMSGNIFYQPIHGSFYSVDVQTNPTPNTAMPMAVSNTTTSYGITVTANTQFNIPKTDKYNIQFSAYVTKTGGGTSEVDIWLAKNGNPVDWTNSSTLVTSGSPIIAAWNFVEPLNAGDYVQLMWSSADNLVTLQSLAAKTSPVRPGTPSVIVTITPAGA